MKIIANLVILFSLSIRELMCDSARLMNHRLHLSDLAKFRHPLEPNHREWINARNYVEKSFESSGLHTEVHRFKTKIATAQNSIVEVEGQNLIGHSQSANEKAPVILVGSYYDTTLKRNPLAETGTSVAALLEIANLFHAARHSNKLAQNITALFVAFDLNVKNYAPLGSGLPGSYFLAQDWLPKFLNGRPFLGAVLLDSISNFNREPNSQHMLPGYEVAFPMAYKRINESEFRADFIGLKSRSDERNKNLNKRFQMSYSKLQATPGGGFGVVDLEVRDGVSLAPALLDRVKRSPQFDFWTSSPPLPAILLTDMDITRKDFDADKCRVSCTVDEFWSDTRKTFVEASTASVIDMLLHYETVQVTTDGPDTDLQPTPATEGDPVTTAEISPGNNSTAPDRKLNIYLTALPSMALFCLSHLFNV